MGARMIGIGELRGLKGAPLSVLIALVLAKQPVGQAWLSMVTGYSDKPVDSALRLLAQNGLVTHNGRYSWQIGAGVMQLALGEDDLTRNNSESITTTAERSLLPSSINSSSSSTTTRNYSESIMNAIGIMAPTDKKLSALPWVTPGYVWSMGRAWRKERQAGNKTTLGLLVHRLRSNDPAPELRCSCYGILELGEASAICDSCGAEYRYDE
jgi:hypothetical protein